jgi:hypothetical protein
MNNDIPAPVAIGGVGGSGTRVVAALLYILGYFLGDDLNEAMDNLWFTLLFKRRSILLETEMDFRWLAELFVTRMSAAGDSISAEDRARIYVLADGERLQHSRDWLMDRAHSFCDGRSSKRNDQPWAWKEPNTHILIDRIFSIESTLRYIHIVRNPFNMSVSNNQNQLLNWGPMFLDRDVTREPRFSLAYWCVAHRRVMNLARRWPERTMVIDFDELCAAPDAHYGRFVGFLGASASDVSLALFKMLIIKPVSVSSQPSLDLDQFEARDLAYVEELGYPLR